MTPVRARRNFSAGTRNVCGPDLCSGETLCVFVCLSALFLQVCRAVAAARGLAGICRSEGKQIKKQTAMWWCVIRECVRVRVVEGSFRFLGLYAAFLLAGGNGGSGNKNIRGGRGERDSICSTVGSSLRTSFPCALFGFDPR